MKKMFLMLSSAMFFMACERNSVDGEDENELITTAKIILTEGGTSRTFAFKDLDGDGGTAPTIDKISLAPNKTYSLAIQLLNEAVTPVGDITKEVETEAAEHLLIYTPSPMSLLTFEYTDKDSRNFPIGLKGTLKTNRAGSGKLKVQLRHQSEASGKATKDGSATPGSDDLNIDFEVVVQ